MPTAARLVSAICLMFVAYFLSMLVIPLMPESTDFGYFVPVNLVLGLCIGWIVMGKRVGRGTTAAINNGLTGVFVFQMLATALIFLGAYFAGAGRVGAVLALAFFGHGLWQVTRLSNHRETRALEVFKSNLWAGTIIVVGLVAAALL